MTKLIDQQIGLIILMNRSPKDADGWRVVSEALCDLFAATGKPYDLPPELYEFEKLVIGGRVRFTERGEVLAAYV